MEFAVHPRKASSFVLEIVIRDSANIFLNILDNILCHGRQKITFYWALSTETEGETLLVFEIRRETENEIDRITQILNQWTGVICAKYFKIKPEYRGLNNKSIN